jgi:Leucine-rich repeat (LRR) protein
MPDDSLPLVPLSGSQLARHGSGGGRILDDMVSSALTTSQKQGALIPRYRIGDIDFCEPDYRQMLLWAEHLVMTPEELLLALWDGESNLFTGHGPAYEVFNSTYIENGRLKCVKWDFEKLPLRHYEWMQGLEIKRLEYWGNAPMGIIAPALPTLTSLGCCGCQVLEIDLDHVPSLRELDCSCNELGKLNFGPLPRLTKLDCACCGLTELELTNITALESLDCCMNELSEIHLEFLGALKVLSCSENRLRKLSLANCEMLEKLYCPHNHLSELDLSKNPKIRSLSCEGNMLEELDIRPLQYLEELTYDHERTRLIQRPDQDFEY